MSWRNIKIFVSSTFKDMDVERDTLKNIVEPRINEFLKAYMCSLEFVDLRHSVKTDASMSQTEREKCIFSVCLEEIENCSPYFLVLLGHRYGWIPAEDNVPCPKIELPPYFPVEEKKLSVTSYEILHGLYSSTFNHRGLVYLRNLKSYASLTEKERDDFIDTEDTVNYIENIRTFLNNDKSQIPVVEYTLNLRNSDTVDLADWAEMMFDSVKQLINQEYITDDNDELSKYQTAQEAFVQLHLKHFRGRTLELYECKQKIEERHGCLITAKEEGLGRSAFLCRLYSDYRSEENNQCLFYSPNSSSLYDDMSEVLYFWCLQLDKQCNNESTERIILARGDRHQLLKIIADEILLLKNVGKTVYAFCDTVQDILDAGNTGLILVNTCIYDVEFAFLRPLMYMLEPYQNDTISIILNDIRPQVRSALMQHNMSRNAKWLNIAITIVDKMNKADFLAIRQRIESDNEERIVTHQVELVKTLPDTVDDIILFWIRRLKTSFGNDIPDAYLYLMSLNSQGWQEKYFREMIGCDPLLITMFRQMLGSQIVMQTENGQWCFADEGVNNLVTDYFSKRNMKEMLVSTYTFVQSLSPYESIYGQTIFKLAMLNNDIDFCIDFIQEKGSTNSEASINGQEALYWYASQMKYDFLSFVSRLTSDNVSPNYDYFANLIHWIKKIWKTSTEQEYVFSIGHIKNCLRKLWQNHKIDLSTYSLVCEVIACEIDYDVYNKDYKSLLDNINYGMVLSNDYYTHNVLWMNYYLYFTYRVLNTIKEDERRMWCLEEKFLTPERKNIFHFPDNIDTTIYAILLSESAISLVIAGRIDEAEIYLYKSFEKNSHLLELQTTGTVKSTLLPIDTKRNMLQNLCTAIELHIDYNFLSKEKICKLAINILEVCSECRLLDDQQETAYVMYHKAMTFLLMTQEINSEKKVLTIYRLADQIMVGYGAGNNHFDSISFQVIERNYSQINLKFMAWIYTKASLLYLLSDMPQDGVRLPDEFSRDDKFSNIMKKQEFIVFEEELSMLLPLIGAKGFDDEGLPPNDIQEAVLIMYLAMLNWEIAKSEPQLQYMISIYNSCCDVYESINKHKFLKSEAFAEKISNFGTLIQQACDVTKDTELDTDARFEGFVDCFGMSGDLYLAENENGIWANGDPELNQIHISMTQDNVNAVISGEDLEQFIDNEEYGTIIEALNTENELTVVEMYYLALAYLRSGNYQKSYYLLYMMLDTEDIVNVMSNGETFSTITNFLFAALLSHHYDLYESMYRDLGIEEKEDEDIQQIHEAYKNALEQGLDNVTFYTPLGFKL